MLFDRPPQHSCSALRAAIAFGISAFTSLAWADPPFDPFGTESDLRAGVSGAVDPFARLCPPPPQDLSLAAALEVALCRNPSTRSAWASAREQAAALGIAESAWVPDLTVTWAGSRTNGPHTDSAGNTVSGTQRISDAAANLSWTLLDFGARSGRVRSAHRLLDAAAATTNRVTQQTVLSVMQSYYAALAADADVAAARTNETVSARSLEVARGRRSGGIATLADVLQAETAYDQAVLARVQTEGTARSAHGGLAVVIGSTADQPFTLAEEPVPTNIPTLTARMQDLMAEAMQQRPDLAAARAQSEAAEASVTVARAAGWPTISIAAGRSYIETQGLPLQNYSTVGINVTWPIFTGFQTSYGIRQALAAVQASEANAEQVRLNVSLDVWNGYYALDSANKQLAATAALSKSAAENEEVALGRYESGVGSIVDVLTAQSAAASARHQRVVAELTWRDARAQLALALGHLTATEPLSDPKAFP